MSVAARTKHRWDTRAYGDIASVRHSDGTLVVQFADGEEVRVPTASLDTPRFPDPQWDRVSAGEFWISVPTAAGEREISWVWLRSLTDPDYDAHLRAAAVDGQRRLGQRLVELRTEHRIGAAALADQAGVTPELLAQVEAGKEPVSLDLLHRLVAPMGLTLAAFADDEAEDAG